MRRSAKVFICALAGAPVAIPVTLVLAGTGNGAFGDADDFSTTHTGREEAKSKQWKPLPEISELFSTDAGQTVAVSAAMARGRVRVRIFDTLSDKVVKPGPVAFTAKAANSFSWGVASNCFEEDHEVQWKRVGKEKAVASKLSAQRIAEFDPCI